MKVGLFFGSFNPIHNGHLMIANYFVEFSDIDELWFVVSPHNPLKEKHQLLNFYDRADMVSMAIKGDDSLYMTDIENSLPQPSYTIDTLTYIQSRNRYDEYVLIMGSDQLPSFHKWKNHEELAKRYMRYVYPRPGFAIDDMDKHTNIQVVKAPLIEISSSFIRQAIAQGKNMRHFLPEKVYTYIRKQHFYQ